MFCLEMDAHTLYQACASVSRPLTSHWQFVGICRLSSLIHTSFGGNKGAVVNYYSFVACFTLQVKYTCQTYPRPFH